MAEMCVFMNLPEIGVELRVSSYIGLCKVPEILDQSKQPWSVCWECGL